MQSTRRLFKLLTAMFLWGVSSFVFGEPQLQRPPIQMPDMPSPELIHYEVDGQIVNQVATVTVRQTFVNRANRAVEGIYLFPLPKGAGVSDFKMLADGKTLQGEILDRDQARQIYEDIVRRQLDPALLEYAEQNLFKVSIFPIPAGGRREITLSYSALLPQDGGLVQFNQPLGGRIIPHGKHGHQTQDQAVNVVVRLRLETDAPLKNIYSPTQGVDIHRDGQSQASVGFEGEIATSSQPFILYYSLERDEFGMDLLTFDPDNGDEGYFMLLLSPGQKSAVQQDMPKDILFVLDISGSMAGEKLDQAKGALRYCLNRLGGKDRFNLITFSTEAEMLFKGWRQSREERDSALTAVEALEASGSTHIEDALRKALSMAPSKTRPVSVVFLTDGLPTAGEQDAGKIVAQVKKALSAQMRIFTFGVGYDVNTFLLDQLASVSRAVSDYIEPGESIEARIAGFYDKIRYPALTELSLDFGRMEASHVYPRVLPDLYYGNQITLMGRYRQSGSIRITLRGKESDHVRRITREIHIRPSSRHDFLPQLWATRKMGMLVDEMRLQGSNTELEEEIIRLSKQFGVMSPLTSYLVQETPGIPVAGHKGSRSLQGAAGQAPSHAPGGQVMKMQDAASAPPVVSGVQAVRTSKQVRELKEAEAVEMSSESRQLGALHFYRKDDFWVDSRYQDEKTVDLLYGSEAYQDFALKFTETARILALGEKVIFQFKDCFVKVSDTGKSIWAKGEMEKIFN